MKLQELKFDFSRILFDKQIVKIIEEVGEVIKAKAGKEGDLKEELADVIIASYGLARTIFSQEEVISIVNSGIEKVNNRIKDNSTK